jgi:hypothetical protein
MLSWRAAGGLAAASVLAVLGLPGMAVADGSGGVDCPPLVVDCSVHAGGPGHPGGGQPPSNGGGNGPTSGGAPVCTVDDVQVPCQRNDVGWFNPADHCYWKALDPQPGPDDPLWKIAFGAPADGQPGKGALYNVTCTGKGTELQSGTTYSASPPPGYGGIADPAALAQQMVTQMGLLGADIGTAPKKGSTSLVGLPVWLWNTVSTSTWGPKTANASAGGVTVTATAHVDRIIWSTGDGTSVTCNGPGVKYDPTFGTQQPACGYTYTKPGQYTITATSKWVVDWTATTGQRGQIPVDRTATTTVDIAEAQAVNNQ